MRSTSEGLGQRRLSQHHKAQDRPFTPNWPACVCPDCESSERLQRIAALITSPLSREDKREAILWLVQSEKITRQSVRRKRLAIARLAAHLPDKPRKIGRSALHRRASGQSHFCPLGIGAGVRYLDLPPRNAFRHFALRAALERTPFWVTYRRLRARFRKKHIRLVTKDYRGFNPIDKL